MENETQHQTTVSPVNPLPPTQRPKKSKIGIIIGLIIFFLVILLGLGYYYLYIYAPKTSSKSVNQSTQTDKTQPKVVSQKPESVDPLMAKFTNPASGEKWYTQPKKLGDLGYFNGDESTKRPDEYAGTEYYEVGTRENNTIILAYMSYNLPGPGEILFLEKSPDSTITAILNPNNLSNINGYTSADDMLSTSINRLKSGLAKNIKIDTTIQYDSLNIANTKFPIGNGVELSGASSGQFSENKTTNPIFALGSSSDPAQVKTIIKKYGLFKIDKETTKLSNSIFTSISYSLDSPIINYTLTYPVVPASVTKYSWNNNIDVKSYTDGLKVSQIKYNNVFGGGCGVPTSSISQDTSAKDTDFVQAGRSDDGLVIYTYKDQNNSNLQELYKDYTGLNDFSDSENTKHHVLTITDFINQHAVIAYKDNLNGWLTFVRSDLFPAGGCGKPVIYLYPAKTQRVSVKVGAKIEKSEPKYNPETGWKVLANPNGQLTINNEKYNSLFWEGLGNGFYPNVTNGTIIKKADAAKTMRDQLKQQGLNQTEINDFMDYWQSKIPNKPYIRLTWFNTAQMNELAPLAISPKPQTLIRVFLDMKGLDKKISIPTQKLTSIPRQGFTAIEWGGLLRGGIK